jgi:hypothetical protein
MCDAENDPNTRFHGASRFFPSKDLGSRTVEFPNPNRCDEGRETPSFHLLRITDL